jgi:hypothetical protein
VVKRIFKYSLPFSRKDDAMNETIVAKAAKVITVKAVSEPSRLAAA